MLARIRKSMEEKDQGFTLIELLVVMIIIGILAAIAIPVFLNQRANGYRSALKSDLKNAATAVESYAVDAGGSYAGIAANTTLPSTTPAIEFTKSTGVTSVTVKSATATGFCIEAVHGSLASAATWSYKKSDGVPKEGACS